MRTIITEEFLKRIRTEGQLAKAFARLKPLQTYDRMPRMSTWSLVCEEAVDTTYEPEYYEKVIAELLRRDFTPEQIEEMRMFAWNTAGWLNFEKMIWDWCSLNDDDIETAIKQQLQEGEITPSQAETMTAYLEKYRQPKPAKT